MLKGKLKIDLPSAQTDRKMTILDRVRSFCGATIDLASGNEELTMSAMTLLSGLICGFRDAGINNAIVFLVDKKVIFSDVNEREDDLSLILDAAKQSGILDAPFQEMHLALAHRENGVHSIMDIRIKNEVLLGDEEITFEASGRIEELRVRKGESAEEYANRVKAFMQDESTIESKLLIFQQMLDRIASSLQKTLIGSTARQGHAQVEIVRPGKEQMSRFNSLKFGDDVEDPKYRSVPTQQRSGAYADPFYYYYYDPYYGFTDFLLLNAMLSHHYWHSPYVHVVNPQGQTLYTGSEASSHAQENWGADSVGFSSDGGVHVESGGSFADNAGADWGGSAVDWSSSNTPSSDDYSSTSFDPTGDSSSSCSSSDSSSSCGSSCGGSSCGSSCGGSCS